MPTTLAIRDLSFSYGAVGVLHGVNMTMDPGQITCIMGRNGVGKTTLMKNVMGLLKPREGSVLMNDRDLTGLPANRRARSGLSLVAQGRQIFPKLTVEQNLQVGLEANAGRSRKVPEQVYEYFPILRSFRGRMGGDLSGGQQQQLAIARALVGNPDVLLLDEPTEGVQPNIIQQIGAVLRRLVETGMTVVLVEQYLDFVREYGHHFYVMNRGRVVAQGETAKLSAEIVSQHLSV
jgi:urea transport system ATP-binding protein